jgi:hypothetical protein
MSETADEDQPPFSLHDNSTWACGEDRWDDGLAVEDESWSIDLWCGRCGRRPRQQSGFCCRLHDEQLHNGATRPTEPTEEGFLGECHGDVPEMPDYEAAAAEMDAWEVAMEGWESTLAARHEEFDAAIEAHAVNMAVWVPEWKLVGADAAEDSTPGSVYGLCCPRCGGATELCGRRGGMGFRAKPECLIENTKWLPEAAAAKMMGGVGGGGGRKGGGSFNTGQHGTCRRCCLAVGVVAGEEE